MTHIDTHFQPAAYPAEAFDYRVMMRRFGISKADAKRQVQRLKGERVVRSSSHQVAINADGPPGFPVTWLAIKRVDRSPILDRLELGRVAQVLMPGRTALELLPLPDRVVDTANSYHLFVLPQDGLASFDGCEWVSPPHLGDWRQLQAWKEVTHPRSEAALVVAGPDRIGEVMVAPADWHFQFGFRSRSVTGESMGGAVQRAFE